MKVAGQAVSPVEGEKQGSRSGSGDLTLTSFLNWTDTSHISAGFNVYIPVGAYDADRIMSLGRNYWSFDPVVTYTWLDPKRGHEISVTTGLMFNTSNDATDYSSGDEWHLDFMLAQHFSAKFALGLEGYLLRQINDDSGALLDRANRVPALGLEPLGGFRAEAFALGPAVSTRRRSATRTST